MSDVRVSDLLGMLERAKAALTEARRPDLAERVHVVVRPDGRITLSCTRRDFDSQAPDPILRKFVSIDPVFEEAS